MPAERIRGTAARGRADPGFAHGLGHRAGPRDRHGGEVQVVRGTAAWERADPGFAQRLGHRAGPRDRSGGEVQLLSSAARGPASLWAGGRLGFGSSEVQGWSRAG